MDTGTVDLLLCSLVYYPDIYQALLEVHDEVAAHIQNSLEEVKYIDGVSSNEDSEEEDIEEKDSEEKAEKSDSSEEIVDTFRVIGLRRKPGESLVIKLDIWKYEAVKQ